MRSLVIVGASLAGLSAARAARAQGFDGRLVLVGDEPERPYDRPPLSKDFLAGRIGPADLALEDDAGSADGAGSTGASGSTDVPVPGSDLLDAQWLLGCRATGFDAASRTVRLAGGDDVSADGVVLATGARARSLPELAGLANVHTLRTLADAQSLAPELGPGGRLVVVGAGFIGLEVASTARELGMEVSVVAPEPVPLAGPLGTPLAGFVADLHTARGVELHCGARVRTFHSCESVVTGLTLEDGTYLPADVVLVGIGAAPNTGWLAGSDIDVLSTAPGGVRCDANGRTSAASVVAVGDCAAWFDPAAGTHRRVEHWSGAVDRPALAVAALLDPGVPHAPVPQPYFWSDQHGTRLQFAGRSTPDHEIVEGSTASGAFVAVYRDGETTVGVLGANSPRTFTGWRRRIERAQREAAAAVVLS